jgi:hypothetical protein
MARPAPPQSADARPYIGTTEAGIRANAASVTVRTWCERLHIGVKVAGRWRIDPAKLDAVLEGGRRGRPE